MAERTLADVCSLLTTKSPQDHSGVWGLEQSGCRGLIARSGPFQEDQSPADIPVQGRND